MAFLVALFSIFGFLNLALADDFVFSDKILINEQRYAGDTLIFDAVTGKKLLKLEQRDSSYNNGQRTIFSIHYHDYKKILLVEKRFDMTLLPAVSYDLSYLLSKYSFAASKLKFSADGNFAAFRFYPGPNEKMKCVLVGLSEPANITEINDCRYFQFALFTPHIYLAKDGTLEKRSISSQALEYSIPLQNMMTDIVEIKFSENSELLSLQSEWSHGFYDVKNRSLLGKWGHSGTATVGDNLFLDGSLILSSAWGRTALLDLRYMSEMKVLNHRCDKLWANPEKSKIICANSYDIFVYSYRDLNLLMNIKENRLDGTILYNSSSNQLFWHNKLWDLTSGKVVWSL